MNNLTDTELETLEQQYAHVSAENKRLMAENLRYQAAFADIERDLPCMNVLVRKRICDAIARARAVKP